MMKYEARWFAGDTGASADTPDEVDFYFHDKSHQLYKAIYNATNVDITSINWSNIGNNQVEHTDRVYHSRRRQPTWDKVNWYRGDGGGASEPDSSHEPEQMTTYVTSDPASADEDSPAATGNGSRQNYNQIGQINHVYDYNRNVTQDTLRQFGYGYDNALKTVTRISDGEQICEYSHDAYGQQVTQTQYWTVGRRAYFDTRFELDVDLNHDGDTHELTYIDGGITSTCLDADPEASPNPDQVQEAKWNSRLDYVSGGSAIHYFDFLIRVPYVANEYYAEPLGYIAYTGTNAIWIFRDKYRVASRHDWTDSLGVDYPLSSGTTAGLHRYGIKVQGGADEFYIDGTLLTGADVDCTVTPLAMAFFGSRAMVNGSAEDECDHLPGIELFDFISYSKAWNYSTGETTTGCVIQDGPEPGPEQKYHVSPVTWPTTIPEVYCVGGSSTVVVETITTVGGGDPEFTIALVNGRRNAIAYVQDGVEDDIASWDEEIGAGYAVETVGITMYNDVDGHGSSTMFATKMTMNGLCAESYTDIEREDTSGSVYFTNARLSLTTVQGLPLQFGGMDLDNVDEINIQPMTIEASDGAPGDGASSGHVNSNGGPCACQGARVSDGTTSLSYQDGSIASMANDIDVEAMAREAGIALPNRPMKRNQGSRLDWVHSNELGLSLGEIAKRRALEIAKAFSVGACAALEETAIGLWDFAFDYAPKATKLIANDVSTFTSAAWNGDGEAFSNHWDHVYERESEATKQLANGMYQALDKTAVDLFSGDPQQTGHALTNIGLVFVGPKILKPIRNTGKGTLTLQLESNLQKQVASTATKASSAPKYEFSFNKPSADAVQSAATKLDDFPGDSSGASSTFHRLESPTQTPGTAQLQVTSGEVWGTAARGSSFPAVKAYVGPLPEGKCGIEFTTSALPDGGTPPGAAIWREGNSGVKPASDPGYVKIDVEVTKNTQTPKSSE